MELAARSTLALGLASAGSLLFAGNTNNNSISVLRISSGCSLKVLKQVTVPGSPAGMKATPNGQFLVAAYIGQVDSFKIDSKTGDLTELGPFSPKGTASGVDISCDGSTAYFGDTATNTQVEVFSVGSSGELKELNNFTNKNGESSNNVMLSRRWHAPLCEQHDVERDHDPLGGIQRSTNL